MDVPETRYAGTPDGVSIAYHAVGDGPIDLLWLHAFIRGLAVIREHEVMRSITNSFANVSRVIRHDMRATVLSSRAVLQLDGEDRATFAGRQDDLILSTFEGPARAVRAAGAIADALGELGVESRAGVHVGEIERVGDDVTGVTVSVAARVAAIAGRDEILVSSTVKDLTPGSGLVFEDAGEYALTGVPDRWRLYRVVTST